MNYREARGEFERQYWTNLLRSTSGDVQAAARTAGFNRTSLYVVFQRYGITNPVRRRLRGNWGDFTD